MAIFEAIGLVKSYGERVVVDGFSCYAKQGEAVGLLGPNGAGKTTSFYMLSGLVKCDSGTILLDGNDISAYPMYKRAQLGIGYLPQESSIFRGLSVSDNIRAVVELVEPRKRIHDNIISDLLEEFKIGHLYNTASTALSGGERRRLEIARCLAARPKFVLLDEPFAGVDPIAVEDIKYLVQHLRDKDIGVLITDHNVREMLSMVDRAYILHQGKELAHGEPQQLVDNELVRKFYLGKDFRL